MKILNPAALTRAELQRLGKHLNANSVLELVLICKDGKQTVRRKPGGWYVTKSAPETVPEICEPHKLATIEQRTEIS